MALTAAKYRTSDRVVQEDAFIFTAKGNDLVALKIASESLFQEDMFSALQSESFLKFDVNLIQPPSAKVLLTMNCEGFGDKPGSCQESIDITKLLNNADINQWQTLGIDLQCFADKGIKFGQMVSPFELSTEGQLSLGIANIVMSAPETNQLTIACD